MQEEEDRLDFGEEEYDEEEVISLGGDVGEEQLEGGGGHEAEAQTTDQPGQDQGQGQGQQHSLDVPLPDGWERRFSRSTGEVYYLNTVSRTTSWDLPTGAATASALGEEQPVEGQSAAATEENGNTDAAAATAVPVDGQAASADTGMSEAQASNAANHGRQELPSQTGAGVTTEDEGARAYNEDVVMVTHDAERTSTAHAASHPEAATEVFAAPQGPSPAGSAWSERFSRLCSTLLHPILPTRLPV